MFKKLKTIAQEANFHWKDMLLILIIGMVMMTITHYVFN